MQNKLIYFTTIFVFLVLITGTSAANPSGPVAYVYSSDISSAKSYKSLLDSYDLPTTLISRDDATNSDFSKYDVIIIGSDIVLTSSRDDVSFVSAINNSGKSIVALGEGGYAFFGMLKLNTGYPYGAHGSEDAKFNSIYVMNVSHPVFQSPYNMYIPVNRTIQLYTTTSNVGIYFPHINQSNVLGLGRQIKPYEDYYPLTLENDKYLLWGFTGSPNFMTSDGEFLFVNVINYMADLSKGIGEIYVNTWLSQNPQNRDSLVPPEHATFTISGPETYLGNESWYKSNATAGIYTINYGPVSGYETPASETKTLTAGDTITFSGNYTLKKKVGDSFDFGDGYVVLIKQIYPEKKEVLMELQLYGHIFDKKIVKEKERYVFSKYGEEGECFTIITPMNISLDARGEYTGIFIESWCYMAGIPKSYISVISTPGGANVTLIGESYRGNTPRDIPVGKTPTNITVIDVKKHTIHLEMQGYDSWEGEFQFHDFKKPQKMVVFLNKTQV